MLADNGSVIGVDIGYSVTRRSSAICRLDWTDRSITWVIERFRATPEDRHRAVALVAGRRKIDVAAVDGPLRGDLGIIGTYRIAERMLTLGFAKRIGKPGQSSAPVGKLLNGAANDCVKSVLALSDVARSRHREAIHPKAVVEAFPSAFMGLMLDEGVELRTTRNARSDVYFEYLAGRRAFERLLARLAPGRRLSQPIEEVKDHDERSALVCALTALGVAAREYCCVGNEQGWIILPPRHDISPWALRQLEANDFICGRDAFHICP